MSLTYFNGFACNVYSAHCTYNLHNLPVTLHNVFYIKIVSDENGSSNTCPEIGKTDCLFNIKNENEKNQTKIQYTQCSKTEFTVILVYQRFNSTENSLILT